MSMNYYLIGLLLTSLWAGPLEVKIHDYLMSRAGQDYILSRIAPKAWAEIVESRTRPLKNEEAGRRKVYDLGGDEAIFPGLDIADIYVNDLILNLSPRGATWTGIVQAASKDGKTLYLLQVVARPRGLYAPAEILAARVIARLGPKGDKR